jgi:hypothetical protein
MAATQRLAVPVVTLIKACETKIAESRKKVEASKVKYEVGEAAARVKIIVQLRAEADRIEKGGRLEAVGSRWDRETSEYSAYEYQFSLKAPYPGVIRMNTKLEKDLALLKATCQESITVTTDSEWAKYL